MAILPAFKSFHQQYSSRDMTWMHNTISHVLSAGQPKTNLNPNQLCAIHLDVMSPSCSTQRRFLTRVPYNCTDCPWTKYPHLADILSDEPNKPKYWRLENNTYCDVSYHGVPGALIDGNFDRSTFGVATDNVNQSTPCAVTARSAYYKK
mmetsp:Transcript_36197/g.108675  ORF Transcript_36197/g.108675 Transcript_36197/m.108675 type:complete len:149 (+) Transcript_36197:91-537(+)